jgi:hypothetical protein
MGWFGAVRRERWRCFEVKVARLWRSLLNCATQMARFPQHQVLIRPPSTIKKIAACARIDWANRLFYAEFGQKQAVTRAFGGQFG